MKRELLLGFVLLCLIGKAQDSTAVLKPKVELSGSYSINSTALTASFYQGLYSGKYIDATIKNSVSKRLVANNLFGVDVEAKALYYSSQVFGQWGVYAGVSYNIDLGAQFTGDVYRLIFEGNANYAGKTADLSGVQVKYMESQSLHFGVYKSLPTGASTARRTIQCGLNFVQGSTWYDIKIDKGSVFTEANGAYLDITMKGNMYQSDTLKNFNGIGAGLNFSYKVEKKNGRQFLIEASNVGVMQWNKNTVHNYVDTTFRFDGFQINNIFAIQDSTFSNISANTITDHLKSENKTQLMVLPFTIHATYLYPLNQKNYLTADLNYKYWATYIPKLIVSYGYKFTQCVSAEVSAGYGGYGQLHAGLNAKFSCKDLQLRVGASDLLGFIAPSSFSNQGAYILGAYTF
jgi:hypothetical protein